MILLVEIGMLIAGLVLLCTGRCTLTKAHIVEGARARLAGLILIVPFPLAFTIGFAIGFVQTTGRKRDLQEWQVPLTLIEVGLVLGCFLLAAVITATAPHAEAKIRRRHQQGEEDSAEDIPVLEPVEPSPSSAYESRREPEEGIYLGKDRPALSPAAPRPARASRLFREDGEAEPEPIHRRSLASILGIVAVILIAVGGLGAFVWLNVDKADQTNDRVTVEKERKPLDRDKTPKGEKDGRPPVRNIELPPIPEPIEIRAPHEAR